ncbi:MAG TPA: bifunctional ADP-heptose synthase [Terriglobia bacterium]|nr:bifunctional ADP-heptose synthase [Terriglobia bacterium]
MKISASDRAALLGIVERFRGQRIVLVGDLVADEFIHGEIARVSREAPVLILKQRSKQIVPGGGANAANNLVDLGAHVTPVGVVGADEAGEALLRSFREKGVPTRRILRRRGYQTPTKSRVLGVLSHGHPQQIVRVDREPTKLTLETRRRLSEKALGALSHASALLVSDYGYGATSAAEVDWLRRQASNARSDLVITVDSRYDVASYRRATAATPNEPEIEAAFGQRIGDNLALLDRLGMQMLRRQALQALLVTRGREGMVLFEPRGKPRHLPIFGSDQVADVTGAGDTVIAAFTLALAAGASPLHAAMLANCAGGLVVMKSGTATVTRAELEEAIRNA